MSEIAKAYVQIVPTTKDMGSNLTSALDGELGSAGEKGGKTWSAAFGGAAKGAVTAVTAVTGATVAMGTAVVKSASATAQYGDNIDKMSQKMGMTAEAYQEWDAVMQHSGTSMETMKASMKTLANAAESGNAAFATLGITEEDLATLNQQELFERTIAGLQNMEDGTQRTYVAGQLLGRGATELGALLNTSAEDTQAMRDRVHELGGVMSDEAVKAAAAYQDSLQDMQTAFQGLSRGLTSEFLPGIKTTMDGLAELFTGNNEAGLGLISQGIDSLLGNLTEQLPKFMEIGLGIVESLATALIDNLPKLAETAIPIITELAKHLIQNLPKIIEAGTEILFALIDGIIDALPELIPAVVEVTLTIVEKLTEPDTLMKLIDAAFQIIGAVAEGLIKALPTLIEKVPQIMGNLLKAILEFLPQLLESGTKLVVELAKGLLQGIGDVVKAIGDVLGKIRDAIHEKIEQAKQWGADLIQNFVGGITSRMSGLMGTVRSIGQGIKNMLGFSEPKEGPLSDFHTYAPDMMQLFAKGIRDNERLITDQIQRSFSLGPTFAAAAAPAAAAGASTNTYNITVNGIEELEELLQWYQSRQVRARMA
jgi:phage-related protein